MADFGDLSAPARQRAPISGGSSYSRAMTGRQPTYVSVKPDIASREAISDLMEGLLSTSMVVPDRKLHCTVCYSKRPMKDPSSTIGRFLPVKAVGDEWAIFGDKKNCLVLKLSSVGLRAIHAHLQNEYGASHDYPTYEPHVTVCDKLPPDFKLPTAKPSVKLTFNGFEVQPIED